MVERVFESDRMMGCLTLKDALTLVEICAGAGGQALGLHQAGFEHVLAVELDETAAATLRANRGWEVAVGDVADESTWNPDEFTGVTLLAGGVPCPPFSVAGKQLGSSDERDLFAWAVELAGRMRPRVLMLENVRGLSAPRFSGYRQRVLDRLAELGYIGQWRLLHAADFGVPQLRPRFILVAMRPEDAVYFRWPEPLAERVTVGEAIRDLMAERGWPHADEWAAMADGVGPTLVGGSKKHGGADLGPTRARKGWAALGVDGRGVADAAPGPDSPAPSDVPPRLTIDMIARIQGWKPEDEWHFEGRKTSQYRQIGNAFPPPVARALGLAIKSALAHEGVPREIDGGDAIHDPVYRALASSQNYVSIEELVRAYNASSRAEVERRLAALRQDFELESIETSEGPAYRLGEFKGFVGQRDHARVEYFDRYRNLVS